MVCLPLLLSYDALSNAAWNPGATNVGNATAENVSLPDGAGEQHAAEGSLICVNSSSRFGSADEGRVDAGTFLPARRALATAIAPRTETSANTTITRVRRCWYVYFIWMDIGPPYQRRCLSAVKVLLDCERQARPA